VAASRLATKGDGPVDQRSGWFGFPASSPTFTVTGGSSRLSAGRPLDNPRRNRRASLSLALHSGAVPNALASKLAFSPGFPSTQRGNAYLAMCPSPLHRHASEASTPARAACPCFGPEGSTLEVLFHPRGFSPPRWVPPLHPLRACCIPLPILGFAAFPCLALRSKTGPRDTSPRRRTYPSKNSPSTAAPRHRGRCAPCRSLRITAAPRQGPLLDSCSDAVGGSEASASRLCSVIGSGTPRRRCRRRKIRSFLGFVPLQGSLLATGASAPPSSHQPLGARRRFAAGKLRFALSSAPPHRRSGGRHRGEHRRALETSTEVGIAEATGAGTTPDGLVPGLPKRTIRGPLLSGGSPLNPAEAVKQRAREREAAEATRKSHPRRIPSKVHRACGALHGPTALRRRGKPAFPPKWRGADSDAIEVYPELKSRGSVRRGFPRRAGDPRRPS